jgi:hypothetical protein
LPHLQWSGFRDFWLGKQGRNTQMLLAERKLCRIDGIDEPGNGPSWTVPSALAMCEGNGLNQTAGPLRGYIAKMRYATRGCCIASV